MKQPFSYYGGKQRIVSKIIPYIPRHTIYVEPFCGGASVFWNKSEIKITNNNNYREVLNDKNTLIVNFSRVLQNEKKAKKLIDKLYYTFYSREDYKKAVHICKNENDFSDIQKAWAFYISINFSFSNRLNSGWSFGCKGNNSPYIKINKDKNLINCIERLKRVYIQNDDALSLIKKWDRKYTFFYIDPPYPGSCQGHYKGYTIEDYKKLIELLKTIKGSFILSCYAQGFEPKEWKRVDFQVKMSASNSKDRNENNTKRTESIWIVDSGGNIEDEYFKKIYNTPGFRDVWEIDSVQKRIKG